MTSIDGTAAVIACSLSHMFMGLASFCNIAGRLDIEVKEISALGERFVKDFLVTVAWLEIRGMQREAEGRGPALAGSTKRTRGEGSVPVRDASTPAGKSHAHRMA
ncbi:hypothetical protein [Arthrobacter alpinus]|uniref:hypothetical protein n=1 Tax=Arthrobacter alpinus TaxID=656366 RepID=UPI001114CFED|nr:hypothetical protein [Arthrobacter alpinus]